MSTSSDATTVAKTAGEIEIFCPADGRRVGSVPDMGEAEVAAMASRLRAAQPAWQELGPRERVTPPEGPTDDVGGALRWGVGQAGRGSFSP